MSIASVCVLISCLILTGAAALFSINVAKMVDEVGESNETIVYIKEGYSQLEAVYVGKEIEKVPTSPRRDFTQRKRRLSSTAQLSATACSPGSRTEIRFPIPSLS